MENEPSCAINSWEFLGSVSYRWLPTNGFAVWCVGLSVTSSSSHAHSDTRLLERYSVTSANAFWRRSCLSCLCVINNADYRWAMFEADIFIWAVTCASINWGAENWTALVLLPVTCTTTGSYSWKSNCCCLPDRMELGSSSGLAKDVHQWFCGYYYHF